MELEYTEARRNIKRMETNSAEFGGAVEVFTSDNFR